MNEPLVAATFLNTLFSGYGLIIVVMALVAITLVSFFMPGGVRKIISIIMIVATAGIGIFILKFRKNAIIGKFNQDLDAYKEIIIEKEKVQKEMKTLTWEEKRLMSREDVDVEVLTRHQEKLTEAKGKTINLEVKQAKLSAKLESRAENLDQGYELGTSAPFRKELDEVKKAEGNLKKQTTQETALNINLPKVADPMPLEKKEVAIKVSVKGFQLKGDVA